MALIEDNYILINDQNEQNSNKNITDDIDRNEIPNEVPISYNNTNIEDININKYKKKSRIIDSDSDDNYDNNSSKLSKKISKLNKKTYNFDDSDSDTEITPNNNFPDDNVGNSFNDDNLLIKRSIWTALGDPDSSESDNNNSNEENNDKVSDVKYMKKKMVKSGRKEEKKMTLKVAAKQREEIRSESQRMLRESNVSLPYHRSKIFTLKEFLAKRPKLSLTGTTTMTTTSNVKTPPPSIAIKMSKQQLEIISKELEERQEKVKEFYKSDSEHEDVEDGDDEDEDEDYVQPDEGVGTITENVEKMGENEEKMGENEEKLGENEEKMGENEEKMVENEGKMVENDVKMGENEGKMVENDVKMMENEEKMGENEEKMVENEEKMVENEEKMVENEEKMVENEEKMVENEEKMGENEGKMVENEEKMGENQVVVENLENPPQTDTKKIQIISSIIIQQQQQDNNNPHHPSPEKEDQQQQKEKKEEEKDQKEEESIEKIKKITEDVTNQNETSTDNEEDKIQEIEDENNDKKEEKPNEQNNRFNFDSEDKKSLKNRFEIEQIDKEIENFLPPPPPPQQQHQKTTIQLEKNRLTVPTLTGSPNQLIDLNIVAKSTEIAKLMERFVKHTKKQQKDNKKININSVEGASEIRKDDDLDIEEKPGVRLRKLRKQLQGKIAERKSEIWKNKISFSKKEDDEEIEEDFKEKEEDLQETEEDLPEKEEDLQEQEDSQEKEEDSLEEEEEEDSQEEDFHKEDKKSIFIDNEAEDTDTNSEKEDEVEDDDDGYKNDETLFKFKKPLRRIIKGFNEDDSDDDDDDDGEDFMKKIAGKLNRCVEDTNTQDDYIQPYQQNQNKTPVKSFSDSKFLTPVSYITGLQNLTNSASKLNVPSPLKETDWHAQLEKKLHANSIITNSQAEAMQQLFSTSNSFSFSENPQRKSPKENLSTRDISNVCSGKFDELEAEKQPTTQDLLDVCSGQFTGISQVSSVDPIITHKLTIINEEMKNLDEDQDMMISQLLNEEEMEVFKRKFDSPVNEVREVAAGGIIDDDDDDGFVEVKKKKKNQKKLTFSDDDESDDENDEEINLHDEDEDEEDGGGGGLDDINYDSEENEVEGDKVGQIMKMADFFEDEAELSESDWGSADEDEKDLDDFEFEQADEEKFDEKRLKTDLEKIHTRRMLDDDTRELKLLQEMLLDDGELHGTGRERQFRWKNIDSALPGDDAATGDNKDDVEDAFGVVDEDESEEQWRRKRHEREMFLMEKKSQEIGDEQEDEDLLKESEILKIGHKVLRKSVSDSLGERGGKDDGGDASPAVKRSFSLVHKRGSFLNRNDQVLDRLVEYNKSTNNNNNNNTSAIVTGNSAKNSKNFLFQTIVQESSSSSSSSSFTTRTTTSSLMNLKRRATDGTPKVIKKLRLTDNLSPAVKKTGAKRTDKNIKTKLFGIS